MKSITLFYEKRWKQQSKHWNGKAAGVDNIPAELVQAGGEAMMDILTSICNKLWKTGEWPATWTQSLVITLLKKVNLQLCQNHHPSKIMLKIILNRLQPQSRRIHCRRASRFQSRKEHHRTNIQSQDPLREIPAASLPCLHSLQGGLWQGMAWSIMGNYEEIQHQCQHHTSHWQSVWQGPVLFSGSTGDWIRTTTGVLQGYVLSPTLFNIFLERIMCEALDDHEGSVSIRGQLHYQLRFADDIVVNAEEDEEEAGILVDRFDTTTTRYKMGDPSRQDESDDKQSHWLPKRDQNKRSEARRSGELQVPWGNHL